MTTIKITFHDPGGVAKPSGNWNIIADATVTGLRTPDGKANAYLKDFETGADTPIRLYVDVAFTGDSVSGVYATMEHHGWPEPVWDNVWQSNVASNVRLTGFSPNQAGTLLVAGYSATAARDTNYQVNGGANHFYDNVAAEPPAAPVTIPFTADSNGEVNLTGSVVSTYWYLTAIEIQYSESAMAGIPAEVIQLDGNAQANLTDVHVRVTAGQNTLNGTQLYSATNATTNASGVLSAIDLSATAAAIGDPVLLHILTADGKGGVFPVTVGAI